MSLFELIYRYRYGYDIGSISQELQQLRALPRDTFLQWQEKKKWDIVYYLYEHNDFYRRHIGDKLPDCWEALPVVDKQHLQGDFEELLSRSMQQEKLYINNTSGSSGHPLTFAKDYYTQARVWAAKTLFAHMHGIDYFKSKEAKFYGMPKAWLPYIVQKIKDLILRRHRFVVFDLSDAIMDRWIERFQKYPFDYVYGYTSSIVLFARHCISRNLILKEICPSLKVAVVTSESCSLEDREIIRQGLGVEPRNEYGTADAGLIGYECTEGKIHLVEENLYIENDEEGNLLITDLFNKAFPLVRYKIGDMASISEVPCACGLHTRTIDGLQGRTNDVAVLKSGKRIPGLTFYYISRALLESSGVLKEFIIRQTALDTFEFDVVSDKPLAAKDIEELQKTAEEYLEEGLNIVVHQVEKIERPASGKIKHFYLELNER